MAIAVDPRRTWELKDGDGTTWHLRPLTVTQEAQLQDEAAVVDQDSKTIRVLSGSTQLQVLRFGLAGVDGFRDVNGSEVPFEAKNGTVKDSFLDRIHPDDRARLAKAITNRFVMTESDAKNSSSAPVS